MHQLPLFVSSSAAIYPHAKMLCQLVISVRVRKKTN
jgi:hypothetical protein